VLKYDVVKYPTRCNYIRLILSVNSSKCFGWIFHPSSGEKIILPTASGTSQPLLLPVGTVEDLRVTCVRCTQHTQISLNSSTIQTGSNSGWPVPDAVDRVIYAPDDEWRNNLKHVEQFTHKINCV
jgi:hypothetical protein